jgi:hypothetical protein
MQRRISDFWLKTKSGIACTDVRSRIHADMRIQDFKLE